MVLDESAGVLVRDYEFAKNAVANTMVFRGSDGLVVVSPGTQTSDRAFDALKEFGEVRALVANNSFHNLGQPSWRARFPNAESFCPPNAVATLDKKVKGAKFKSMAELALPAHVRWDDAPGFRSGETILSVGTDRGHIWYSGDLLANLPRLPPPPLGWLFSASSSAPGYRLFMLNVWFFVKNRKELKAWALDRLATYAPTMMVPAHGPVVDSDDLVALTKGELDKL